MFNFKKKSIKEVVSQDEFSRFLSETYEYIWAIAKVAKVKPDALAKALRDNSAPNYASELIKALDKTLNMNVGKVVSGKAE